LNKIMQAIGRRRIHIVYTYSLAVSILCEESNPNNIELKVFHILHHLHHVATGLDGLPANWFLQRPSSNSARSAPRFSLQGPCGVMDSKRVILIYQIDKCEPLVSLSLSNHGLYFLLLFS